MMKCVQMTNVSQKLKLERAGNIVGKGENAGYRHFLLFSQFVQKPSIYGS